MCAGPHADGAERLLGSTGAAESQNAIDPSHALQQRSSTTRAARNTAAGQPWSRCERWARSWASGW